MRFEVIGPLTVHSDGSDVTPPGRLQRTLVSLLLANPGEFVPVDTLCNELWPDARDTNARAKLQLLVHRIRPLLDNPDRLSTAPDGYRLRVDSGELDSTEFTELAAHIGSADDRTAVAAARRCLDLWRGVPFSNLEAAPLAAERGRLTELRTAVLERLYAAELERNEHAQIVGELSIVAREHPLNERLQTLLMTALETSGRQSDAIEVYHRTRKLLVAELGIDPSDQLQQRYEDIVAAEGSAKRPIPAQLPPSPSRLIGRDDDLGRLSDAIAESPAHDGSNICVITGTAGVGKTSLALAWANHHRDAFPDGQLFFDLRGFSSDEPAEPMDVLAAFIQSVGGNASTLTTDIEQRAAHYRTLVADRRMLIVLDNARSVEQIRPLLAGTPNCLVIVTSRESLAALSIRDDARSMDLERLSSDDSLDLLARYAGQWIREDAASAAQIAEYCAELPLALRITAEKLRTRAPCDLASFVAEIADERVRLDRLDAGDDAHTDIRAVFSWSYQSLNPDAARVFLMCGLLPGRSTDTESIAALAGIEVRDARRALATLVRANLLDEQPDARFTQHDLLRSYSAELAVETIPNADRVAARSRLIAFYSFVASCAMNLVDATDWHRRPTVEPVGTPIPLLADAAAAACWLDLELTSLVELAESAGNDDRRAVIELAQTLDLYPWTRGRGSDMKRLQDVACACARRLDDIHAEARAERVLAIVYVAEANIEESVRHGGRALALFEQVGDRVGVASALNNLGIVAEWRDDLNGAIELVTRALAILTEENEQAKLSVPQNNLAELLMRVGRVEEARELFDAALDSARSVDFGRSVEFSLYGLAGYEAAKGELDTAADLAAEAVGLTQQSGNRHNEAKANVEWARIEARRGNTAQARSHYDEAVAAAKTTGDLSLIFDCVLASAKLIGTDHPDDAIVLYREAIDLARRGGLPRKQERAHIDLADLLDAVGETNEALRQREHGRTLRDAPEDRVSVLLREVVVASAAANRADPLTSPTR